MKDGLRSRSEVAGSPRTGPLGRSLKRLRAAAEYARWSRPQRRYAVELSFAEVMTRFDRPHEVHAYMHHYFHHRAPAAIREHRRYFQEDQRGFGEDAMHAMWWLLLLEEQPQRLLEIGVYRGQVISLWALVGKLTHRPLEIHGVSPFSSEGDSVSTYRTDIEYEADTRASFQRFGLPEPVLVRARSSDPAGVRHVEGHRWDLIYIDGSHEYEAVLADYRVSREHLADGGILVMDDAGAGLPYRPPAFSFAGHEGPSRVVRDVVMKEMRLLGFVGHNAVFRKDR